ncbi:MAG: T9SS type A sorting domain-containing protein, partial [Chitinophagales bacterium]
TGYSDYTNLSTNLNAGETYTMSVTNNYGWDDTRFGVWADWNQNFTFEANEEVFSFNGDGPWTFSITPPNNASLGTTRLRVRLQFGGNYVPDPCDYANFYSGETEDYTLNILGSSGCSTTSIDFNDFENGWGIWNDGGSDARRNSLDQAYAQGTYCVRLRDNTSTSVMTTDNLDLSSFEDITVDFSYYPLSMDNSNEDFWLQISTNGGTSFTTVEEWNLNDEFQNDNTYYESVNIQGPFTSNTQLRFRCDASGNSDWVHIDDVHIKGCSSSNNPIVYNNNTGNHFSKQGETILLDKEKNNEGKMTVFPNPASNELMVKYEAAENTKVSVELYSLEGKKVGTQSIEALKGENTIRLNTSQLPTGMYLLKVNESNRHLSKRVVISR